MKNRLEVAKSLLREDGAMIIAIDENEHLEMGLLAKEIFRGYEIHCVTIIHNPRGVQGRNFSYTHEYAFFVIPDGAKIICDREIEAEEISWSNFRNWGGESERSNAKNCFYPVLVDSVSGSIIGFGKVSEDDYHPTASNVREGKTVKVFPIDRNRVERKWRYARQSVEEIKNLLRTKKTKKGCYEIEIGKDFGTYRTVWCDPKYDANEHGTRMVKSLVPGCRFDFPKSLYNVFDCIHSVCAEDKNAIILDFFAGSGTTAHAVLELNKKDNGNRKFILCEQMDYVKDITVRRVRKVMENNDAGSFVYAELIEWNEKYMREVKNANTSRKLVNIYGRMKKEAFFRYEIDLSGFDETEFEKLMIEEQKHVLFECLDKNHLYVNLSEIDDATYKVGTFDKKLNREFYETIAQP